MEEIDVDEIAEITYPEEAGGNSATVLFKDGSVKTYNGADHPEVFGMLNHWTPPTA